LDTLHHSGIAFASIAPTPNAHDGQGERQRAGRISLIIEALDLI
jgi:hypothetical protein